MAFVNVTATAQDQTPATKLPSVEKGGVPLQRPGAIKLGQSKTTTNTYPFQDEQGEVDVVVTTKTVKSPTTGLPTDQVHIEFKRKTNGAANRGMAPPKPETLDFAEDQNGVVLANNGGAALQRGSGSCDLMETVQSAVGTGQSAKPCVEAIRQAVNETRGQKKMLVLIRIYQLAHQPCRVMVRNIFSFSQDIVSCLSKSTPQ